MNNKAFIWGVIVGSIAVASLGHWGVFAESRDGETQMCISPKTVANYVHAVIQADRAVYTTEIVERMQLRGIVVASENWEQRGTLPLPVQFLSESARLVAQNHKGVRFRLISLWPVNKRNGPSNEFERAGLEDVRVHPDRPYTGIIEKAGKRYFQGVYADRAVSQACVGCHNSHPETPKADFKLNDVMGGVVINIPLEE